MPGKTQKDKPEEIDASAAAVDEVLEKPITFNVRGTIYTVERKTLRSLAFRAAIQDGDDTKIYAAILGPTQWASFMRRHGAADWTEILPELGTAFGLAAGTGNS